MNKQLVKSVMQRVETWSEAEQPEPLGIALEIEARRDSAYRPTPEELAGIDRGLRNAGKVATDADVEAVFAKYRR